MFDERYLLVLHATNMLVRSLLCLVNRTKNNYIVQVSKITFDILCNVFFGLYTSILDKRSFFIGLK